MKYFVGFAFFICCITSSCQNSSFYEEEVRFVNSIDGAVLAGTFTKPEGIYAFPTAVLVSGSGLQDRDETVYGHKPFKVLAEFLSSNGIAVLRFDDRGYGKSTGEVLHADLETFAGDAYAAVKYLQSRKDIDPHKIGLIGHSLGAMQGMMLASRHDDIAFLVLLAGPGMPYAENNIKSDSLLQIRKAEYPKIGRDKAIASSLLLRPMMMAMQDPANDDDMEEVLLGIIDEWDQQWRSRGSSTTEAHAFDYESFASEYALPLHVSCARFYPQEYLVKIKCPVLSLIGSNDIQVLPENNEYIEQALKKGGNNNYSVQTLRGINHLFQKCETGLIDEYAQIKESLNREVLDLILEWFVNNSGL